MHDMLTSPVMGKCPNIEQHPFENVGAHRSNVFMFLFQGVQPNSECLDPTRRETISPSLGMFFCREVIRLFPTKINLKPIGVFTLGVHKNYLIAYHINI